MDATSIWLIAGWFTLHLGALAWAWATRLVHSSRLEMPMQIGFFVAMTAVGGVAWISRHLDLAIWMVSAVTLMAMVLTAVVDLRRLGEPIQAAGQIAAR
jgi:hypothetical protein